LARTLGSVEPARGTVAALEGTAGISYSGVVNWQRANIQAAVTYLRERISAGATDVRTKVVYEGLLEVLEPNRRTLRMQREIVAAAKASVPVHSTRERRNTMDRRAQAERRKANLGPPAGAERRAERDRRTGRDRRGDGD